MPLALENFYYDVAFIFLMLAFVIQVGHRVSLKTKVPENYQWDFASVAILTMGMAFIVSIVLLNLMVMDSSKSIQHNLCKQDNWLIIFIIYNLLSFLLIDAPQMTSNGLMIGDSVEINKEKISNYIDQHREPRCNICDEIIDSRMIGAKHTICEIWDFSTKEHIKLTKLNKYRYSMIVCSHVLKKYEKKKIKIGDMLSEPEDDKY